MTTKSEIEAFLHELKIKLKIYDIFFLDDRGKNQQTLHNLEITPSPHYSPLFMENGSKYQIAKHLYCTYKAINIPFLGVACDSLCASTALLTYCNTPV